jgi:hypothetical protein
MGRMKDIAIGLMTQPDQDCPNDEELQVLMDNFKPTPEELQAELDELQAHQMSQPCISLKPEYKVYLLMKNGYPQRTYKDRSLAFYECWVCTMGDQVLGAEEPDDWYVVEIMHDESIYTGE